MPQSDDNPNGRAAADDAAPGMQGRAAMLLVESLIHGLIARSVITVRDAMEIVESAHDVHEEMGIEQHEPAAQLAKSLAIFRSISASLAPDLDGESASSFNDG